MCLANRFHFDEILNSYFEENTCSSFTKNAVFHFSLLLMILAACHSNVPLDLQLENLSVVSLNESPQLLPWIGDSEKIDRGKIKILEIDFSSDLDIVEFAKKIYTTSATQHICAKVCKRNWKFIVLEIFESEMKV